jgi:hypothetical protein
MKVLEKEFIRNGFQHLLQDRQGEYAIYTRLSVNPRTLEVDKETLIHYEVIRIKIQRPSTIILEGAVFNIEEKEVYPKDYAWGVDGFSFNDYADAKNFFNALISEKKEEENGMHSDNNPLG